MMSTSPHVDIVERFLADGICFPIPVMSIPEALSYGERCDELEEALGGTPRTVEVRQMHLHFPWAFELATRPAILDAVELLLGPNLVVWATELFAKHPQDSNVAIGWHRDRAYIGFPPADVVTVWLALSDSNAANGCIKAVPGPDRFELSEAGDGALNSSERIPEESIDASRVVDVELRPGEISMHDPTILHGSSPNLSDRKRVGFVIRFVRAGAEPFNGRPPVVVVRGDAPGDRYELLQPPREGDADLDALRASARRHLDAILVTLGRNRQ